APPPTQIYTLSLHDALPILRKRPRTRAQATASAAPMAIQLRGPTNGGMGKPRRPSATPTSAKPAHTRTPTRIVRRMLQEKRTAPVMSSVVKALDMSEG